MVLKKAHNLLYEDTPCRAFRPLDLESVGEVAVLECRRHASDLGCWRLTAICELSPLADHDCAFSNNLIAVIETKKEFGDLLKKLNRGRGFIVINTRFQDACAVRHRVQIVART